LSAIHEFASAQQAYEECRDIYQSLGYRRGVATVIQNLGGLAFDLGDYAQARALFCDGLRIRHELGLQRGYAYSFEYIADVDEAQKRYEQAVQLLAAAETLRARIGAPVEQINRKENEDALTRLRAQPGDVGILFIVCTVASILGHSLAFSVNSPDYLNQLAGNPNQIIT
jgi:tetratricopeptide (TPR) repeat protein